MISSGVCRLRAISLPPSSKTRPGLSHSPWTDLRGSGQQRLLLDELLELARVLEQVRVGDVRLDGLEEVRTGGQPVGDQVGVQRPQFKDAIRQLVGHDLVL